MVFEVDNTTEQLIQQLQNSIQDTIGTLEDGQRQIKELIDEVKESSGSLATADQADSVSEDILKVRTAIQKLATADQSNAAQEKILGSVKQEVQTAATDIKAVLPEMNHNIEQQTHKILESQRSNTERLEGLIAEMSDKKVNAIIAQLQAVAKDLDTLSEQLGAQLDKLSTEAGTVLTVAENNRAVLSSIVDYLSMPGYKRFFKGMEVSKNETSQ